MGSLISTPLSGIVATLEVLANLGVTDDDFADIRIYPVFAREIASHINERRAKITMALERNESNALLAIKELSDVKLLVYIAKWARLERAAEVAMRMIPGTQLMEIVRWHDGLDRVKTAARVMSNRHLDLLLADSSIQGTRREILVGEKAAGNY